jgi:hypothetical protein
VVAEIFGPSLSFLGGSFVVMLVGYGLPIWAIVDVSAKSRVAFYQAGSSKTAWIVVLAIGLILSPLGLFSSGYYLVFARRKVLRFQKSSDV